MRSQPPSPDNRAHDNAPRERSSKSGLDPHNVKAQSSERSISDKDALLANIALLYYGEGLTQSEIAQRMKLSRATIVNFLREARDRGIVEIRVQGRHLAGGQLARDLRARYGLEDVYVSRETTEGAALDGLSAAALRERELSHLARVAAMAFHDILEPGDRVGVAWSETIYRMALQIPRQEVAGVEVCQMVGSVLSARMSAAETCAIEIANALSARCYTLHAPGLVSTPELAKIFLEEPTIARQLARLDQLDLAVSSIGDVSDDTHLVSAGIASLEDLRAARAQGAQGVICCRYINGNGQGLNAAPNDRLIGIKIETLKAARKRLLVVRGAERVQAVRAAIKGGLVSHLCLDQNLAEALLAD